MKILHVISSLDGASGGTSWACAGLAYYQSLYTNLKTTILCTQRPHEDTTVVRWLKNRSPCVPVEQQPPSSLPLIWHPRTKQTLRDLLPEFDAIHIHGLWEDVQYRAAKIGCAMGKKVILAPHGMLDPWSFAQGTWKKRLYWKLRWQPLLPRIGAFHFITASERALAVGLGSTTKERAITEILGVEPSELHHNASRSDTKQLLFLSRLHYKKNLEFLIEALSQLKNLSWTLKIVGDGEKQYISQINDHIRSHGLSDRIHIVGPLAGEEKWKSIQSSDLFLLPSKQENFGIVVAEALVSDLPVLISTHVGLGEDIKHYPGVHILPLEKSAWTQKIAELLDSPITRPHWAREYFDWRRIASRWPEHYRTLK